MSEYLEEIGEVVEMLDESMIKIILKRHSSCERCGACGIESRPEMAFSVKNSIGAVKGDRVVLRMRTGNLFKAAFLVYTIPLFMLIIGFLIGRKIAAIFGVNADTAENSGILTGFLFLGITYLGIRWWDRKMKVGNRLQPELVRIVSPEVKDFSAS